MKMKKYYSIVGAYEFKDKKTGDRKFWISGILQTKYPVRWTREFYFSESEFFDQFDNFYDANDFNLWLKNLYLEIIEDISVVTEME